jgi:uncharacterized protein YdhG (YjbR/CyaY superfamily)
METYTTIDEYIANFSGETQQILQKIRILVQELAPEATEKISYGIPTFALRGKNLVHFAAFEHHIGFYPGPSPIAALADDLKGYETSKGTVRFPLDKPIPYDLITELTKASIRYNVDKW